MSAQNTLTSLGALLASGGVEVIDCSGVLGPNTPIIQLPEDFAKATPKVEIHKISEYDEDGPFFAWNWMVLGEHSGTHFDAPHHWITGKDYSDGFTDTLDVNRLIAPDFLLTADLVKAWEAEHGEINAGEWVVMRTDWDSRANDEAAFLNADENGPHSPGPTPDCIEYLLSKKIVGLGQPVHRYRCRPSRRHGATLPCAQPLAPRQLLWSGIA
ncbi:hypothetical protein GQR58_030015 [Nymphon striatum]|nr:hypothetical protein GQR58_030015 [Nymphon striatum]